MFIETVMVRNLKRNAHNVSFLMHIMISNMFLMILIKNMHGH
jgi:hypothetical protein